MVGRVVYDVIRMDRGYRQRMSNPATSALFAHRTEISVGARKAIFVDLQMVPYGQSGHRILALIPSQSEAELMGGVTGRPGRSEEHTSELQSLMRISYAVFCLKKKNTTT